MKILAAMNRIKNLGIRFSIITANLIRPEGILSGEVAPPVRKKEKGVIKE